MCSSRDLYHRNEKQTYWASSRASLWSCKNCAHTRHAIYIENTIEIMCTAGFRKENGDNLEFDQLVISALWLLARSFDNTTLSFVRIEHSWIWSGPYQTSGEVLWNNFLFPFVAVVIQLVSVRDIKYKSKLTKERLILFLLFILLCDSLITLTRTSRLERILLR